MTLFEAIITMLLFFLGIAFIFVSIFFFVRFFSMATDLKRIRQLLEDRPGQPPDHEK